MLVTPCCADGRDHEGSGSETEPLPTQASPQRSVAPAGQRSQSRARPVPQPTAACHRQCAATCASPDVGSSHPVCARSRPSCAGSACSAYLEEQPAEHPGGTAPVGATRSPRRSPFLSKKKKKHVTTKMHKLQKSQRNLSVLRTKVNVLQTVIKPQCVACILLSMLFFTWNFKDLNVQPLTYISL